MDCSRKSECRLVGHTSKPVQEMTRDELIATFDHVTARHGTYRVSANRLTRHNAAELQARFEGHDQVQVFDVQGDTLILRSPDPTNKSEARFRRVKGPASPSR